MTQMVPADIVCLSDSQFISDISVLFQHSRKLSCHLVVTLPSVDNIYVIPKRLFTEHLYSPAIQAYSTLQNYKYSWTFPGFAAQFLINCFYWHCCGKPCLNTSSQYFRTNYVAKFYRLNPRHVGFIKWLYCKHWVLTITAAFYRICGIFFIALCGEARCTWHSTT